MSGPAQPTEPIQSIESLTAADILEARTFSMRTGGDFMAMLAERLGTHREAILANLASRFEYSVLDMLQIQALHPAFDLVSYADAASTHCVALTDNVQQVWVLLTDPFDQALQIGLEDRLQCSILWALIMPEDLTAYLASQEEMLRAMDGLGLEHRVTADARENSDDLSLASIAEDASPVVKLVNSTLYDALKVGASDIHLETNATGMQVKYRIDGVLASITRISNPTMAEQIVSRIKVLAELDIAEKRVPQDGRFKVNRKEREIDIRVSIMPSLFGEDAVLRILDKQTLTDQVAGLRLDFLGFDEASLCAIRKLAAQPYGMFLVTGPTGSGKTTTLYGAVTEINNGRDKIVTIEDPVEYQLPGILQIPVNEKKGLTFARGLRSILRHDPDKILVGEIRDAETAQIAVQSALTGHLVFTTVHANNVFDVIGRFMHMGVDAYSFVSALNGILAQRLVRVLCPHCVVDVHPELDMLHAAGISAEDVSRYHFCTAPGCGHCRGTGYKGRKAIAEFLLLDDEIREHIIARQPIRFIKEAARLKGTRSLREAALELVCRGETSLEEADRVTLAY